MSESPELKEALDAWENSLDADDPSLAGEQDRASKRAAIGALFDRQREEADAEYTELEQIKQQWERGCEAAESQVASLSSQLERLTEESARLRGEVDWCEQSAVITDLQSQLERQQKEAADWHGVADVQSQWATDARAESERLKCELERLKAEQPFTEFELRILDIAGGRYLTKNYPELAAKLRSRSLSDTGDAK